jgi:hypothetical protein
MTYLPQTCDSRRPARLQLADAIPAVLRFPNGVCASSQLQVVSLTGGLLGLPQPLREGSLVKLMFVTPAGPVLGAAEILSPMTRTQQPFRFVAIHADDQQRLRKTIDTCLYRKRDEQWIEKYRAAISQIDPPRTRLRRFLLAAVSFGTILLGSALYLQHAGLLK